MRLNQAQIYAIEQVFQTMFSHGEVILFGSRVDDHKKGGDIDLFGVSKNSADIAVAASKLSSIE